MKLCLGGRLCWVFAGCNTTHQSSTIRSYVNDDCFLEHGEDYWNNLILDEAWTRSKLWGCLKLHFQLTLQAHYEYFRSTNYIGYTLSLPQIFQVYKTLRYCFHLQTASQVPKIFILPYLKVPCLFLTLQGLQILTVSFLGTLKLQSTPNHFRRIS